MTTILDTIQGPADLKKVAPEDLPILAAEIREVILDTVFKTGGHLASNLGVVELTLALHYTFQFPHDRLLMDVGHQAYPHKLLTGRQGEFGTLRQKDGLSGFLNKFESAHDLYLLGHAGTSISCGLGLSAGDHLAKNDRRTVVLVGDSAIGAGMAFEALNHAGEVKRNLLVVLNDNRMSISKTTGALTRYLSRIRTGQIYLDIDKDVQSLLSLIPVIGERMERGYERLKDAVKAGTLPGQLFENLGFKYYGPVDGHDTDELLRILGDLKGIDGPLLLHVRTEKGRGHDSAAQDPRSYHGVSPKKRDKVSRSGRTEPTPSWTRVFGDAVFEAGRKDDKVVVITAAMPDGTGTRSFQEAFPDRYFDVGICEQHGIGLASGLATGGFKPVVAIYSTFLQRGYDQIFHDVCLQQSNVVFCLDRAGIVGADGATHNGTFDISFLRSLPNIVLMAPKDMAELAQMLRFSLDNQDVCAIRYPRCSAVPPMRLGHDEPLVKGKSELLRDGDDGAILAYGSEVAPALEAARILSERGIDVAVVNARFCKPLDTEMIDSLVETKPFLVTVEEHMIAGGFGSAVLEHAAGQGTPARIRVLGIPDRFLAHAGRAEILADLGLDTEGIVRSVEEMVHAEAAGPWQ
jgi:1-deoxy-D-xylulose-5-phosphate synthase